MPDSQKTCTKTHDPEPWLTAHQVAIFMPREDYCQREACYEGK